MIATLRGRWHTRLFLMIIVGSIVTLPIGLWFMALEGSVMGLVAPYVILAAVLILGLLWEAVYNYLQTWRWERDWPPAFVLAGAVIEAAVVWGVLQLWNSVMADFALGVKGWQFIFHYSIVWLVTFAFSQGPMRILFPRWRFYGGELGH